MAMRPLDQAERDGMRERLGPDAIRRIDALVCAGYVLHACGNTDPAEYPHHLVELADYIRNGERGVPTGWTLHLLDSSGDLWDGDDANGWEFGDYGLHTREAVADEYGPVREVWIR